MTLKISRQTWVFAHRWAGLFMAAFLIVAGVTGSILAFQHELDAWLNPHLFKVEPQGQHLPVVELIEKAQHAVYGEKGMVTWVATNPAPGEAMRMYGQGRLNPETGKPYEIKGDSLFVNPYNGEVLGYRSWGELKFDTEHIIPIIYKIHYTLLLPSPWGMWLFGAAALVWIFDCFAGAYLTFPRGRKNFLQNWQSAWRIKWGAAFSRINLDIHRAFGLWLWGILFIMAVSSVMFNLTQEVYNPVIKSLMKYTDVRSTVAPLDAPVENPALNFGAALEHGRMLMQQWRQAEGFEIVKEDSIYFLPEKNLYQYRVHSSLDLPESYPQTRLYFHGSNGNLIGVEQPYMDAGNTITTWLAALHMGKVFGTWYQIFISILGLAVATLSITGVIIWWKKRQARQASSLKKKHAAMMHHTVINNPMHPSASEKTNARHAA